MFRPTAVTKKTLDIDQMVYCANCKSAMSKVDDTYFCPNGASSAGQSCSTLSVDADHLLRAVLATLIDRVVNDSTIQAVSDKVQEMTKPSVNLHRDRLETAESAIVELNRRRNRVMPPMEQDTATRPETNDEIHEIEKATASLSYESMTAQNELDRLGYLRDVTDIGNVIKNPETYLGTTSPEDAQELLELFVQQVQVINANTAVVVYIAPIETEQNPAGITADWIKIR